MKDNPSLQADMVVLAIGVTPDTVLAKEAGLELGIKESIVVVSYTHLDVYKRQDVWRGCFSVCRKGNRACAERRDGRNCHKCLK